MLLPHLGHVRDCAETTVGKSRESDNNSTKKKDLCRIVIENTMYK